MNSWKPMKPAKPRMDWVQQTPAKGWVTQSEHTKRRAKRLFATKERPTR